MGVGGKQTTGGDFGGKTETDLESHLSESDCESECVPVFAQRSAASESSSDRQT